MSRSCSASCSGSGPWTVCHLRCSASRRAVIRARAAGSAAGPLVPSPPGAPFWADSARSAASSWSASARTASTGPSGADTSSARRWRTRASASGWSKTRVAGSLRPVAVASALRSSTAARESKPRSVKDLPGSMASADPYPRTSATCRPTSSVRVLSCSAGDSPDSRSARSGPSCARPAAPAERRTAGPRAKPRSTGGS